MPDYQPLTKKTCTTSQPRPLAALIAQLTEVIRPTTMHTPDTKLKFIELRAQGWTLRHIASELHVSPRTLVEWNRLLAAEIQESRGLLRELLQETFASAQEQMLNNLLRFYKDIEDELTHCKLKFIPADKLFRIAAQLRAEIKQIRADNHAHDPSPAPPLESPAALASAPGANP